MKAYSIGHLSEIEENLHKCPYCGVPVQLFVGSKLEGYCVSCPGCDFEQSNWSITPEEARDTWNRLQSYSMPSSKENDG